MKIETLSTLKRVHRHHVDTKQLDIKRLQEKIADLEQQDQSLDLQRLHESEIARTSIVHGQSFEAWMQVYHQQKTLFSNRKQELVADLAKQKSLLMSAWREEKKIDQLIERRRKELKYERDKSEQLQADSMSIVNFDQKNRIS